MYCIVTSECPCTRPYREVFAGDERAKDRTTRENRFQRPNSNNIVHTVNNVLLYIIKFPVAVYCMRDAFYTAASICIIYYYLFKYNVLVDRLLLVE